MRSKEEACNLEDLPDATGVIEGEGCPELSPYSLTSASSSYSSN